MHSARTRIQSVFQWFGFGGLLLAVTFFGQVSASTTTSEPRWHLFFYAIGGLGSLCILIGFIILLVNMPRLWKGEDNG